LLASNSSFPAFEIKRRYCVRANCSDGSPVIGTNRAGMNLFSTTLFFVALKIAINVHSASRSIKMPEIILIAAEGKIFMAKKMIYTTTPDVPGREITEILGVISGNIVQSKHVGRDIMAGLKSMVGGEIRGYTEMLTEARQQAISRLVEEALKLGADAVVNIRFTTSSIMSGSSEILASGTAVKLKP
jgi:uncharacterized protein YbjQ (UPF0145 family)